MDSIKQPPIQPLVVNFDAVRTFVALAESGRFQDAADDLAVTQQAVSKRIAALEADLGVRLFTRTPRGTALSLDGQAFLPHARAVLDAVDQATAAVRPGRRALRVDVLGRRIAPGGLLEDFHRTHPAVELEVVTLPNARAAVEAVRTGEIDAAFANLRDRLPAALRSMRVLDEPLDLLTGPAHSLAAARSATPADLAGHRIWIPGIVPGTEWAAYYAELAAALGLTIDATGPNLGTEHLFDVLAESPEAATLIGRDTRLVWTAHQDLRRIPLRDPAPAYPHWLVWRGDNAHPGLATLREHLSRHAPTGRRQDGMWLPSWA